MKKIVVFCICFLITINAYAQTVIKLKDGTPVKGKLVEKTDDYIKVDAFGVTLTYWLNEIESIESKDTGIKELSNGQTVIIILKNGTTLEGKFIEETDGYIKIERLGVKSTYRIDDIRKTVSKEIDTSEGRIIIKGKVIFDNYKQGRITIDVFDGSDARTAKPLSTSFIIPRPGPYTLSLPPSTKGEEVYVHAYNDSDDDGFSGMPEPQDPYFFYGIFEAEPILIDKPVIVNIDLTEQVVFY